MNFRMTTALAAMSLLLATAAQARQDGSPSAMNSMPGMTMPAGTTMPKAMFMPSSISPTDPMSREGSGTSWLPDSSPMYGKMFTYKNGNSLMLHGAAMPGYTDVGSKRGSREINAPNWFMGMYGHPLTRSSQLGLRAMLSLDPITVGGSGYPELFQTGETWHGVPLHDHQHPHDLFDELSATYSRSYAPGRSAYLYIADPGEPALGPPTFMHRLIAYDFADAPIGHHWQDATHVTFGVVTGGVDLAHNWKIEASQFTGREPDENRYNFDKPRWDSSSARLDWNPDSNDALQISEGFIKNPEGDGADVHRATASWIYNHPLRGDSNFTSSVVWGQNDDTEQGVSNSYLEELDYQKGRDTLFSRLEQIQKSGVELYLPSPDYTDKKYWLDAYTVGYVRDLTHGQGIDTGIGAAVTVGADPSSLYPYYGGQVPLSFQVYLRFRPSRSKMDMEGMTDMKTNAAASPAKGPFTVSFAPTPVKAGADEIVTVLMKDPAGHPITDAEITSTVTMAEMDMGTTHPVFAGNGDGTYQAHASFAMAGRWRIALEGKTPEGRVARQMVEVVVGAG